MLDFSDANIQITKEQILRVISEYDIFKYYCHNFQDLDKSFCSELRMDKNPGCRIYVNSYNQLRYKDFASGENYDCWNYIMNKYNCTYYEALNIIANDFRIKEMKIDIDPKTLLLNDNFKDKIIAPKTKSIITITSQNFNITDYNYWNQFGINFDILNEYNVFSAKYVYLFKGDKRYQMEYTKTNPCYAYRFTRDGEYTYKIYWPYADKHRKWLFSGGAAEDIEGYDQLRLHGDLLILTKSLKDVMCYRVLGYDAISLQGEANKLDSNLVNKLLKRFDRIIVNYDEDEEGIRGTVRLKNQFGFNSFFIDQYKDLSDYIKTEGLDKAKIMIDGKINNCL